jgi:hypothetical protein
MDHDCKQEVVIDMLREDLREIKKDIKKLLKIKWQFLGGSALLGVILYLIGFTIKLVF